MLPEPQATDHGAVAAKAAIRRSWFIRLSGGTKTVNRVLEAKAGGLGGPEGVCHPTTAVTPSTASSSTHVRTGLAQLRLQVMIRLKMPGATRRVILACGAR